MKYLLISNYRKQHTSTMAREVAAWLRQRSIECDIDDGCEPTASGAYQMIIVLGGDGTMLRAARRYGQSQIPVLGVNLGTVGSMSNINSDELLEYLPEVIKGRYTLEYRLMLTVRVYEASTLLAEYHCLNEAVLKATGARMISLMVQIDDGREHYFSGDGLMVATPTGSSAYSLSAGGPLMDPVLQALLITPLASNTIAWKPVVLGPERRVRLRPLNCDESILCLDGQTCLAPKPGSWGEIIKAENLLPLVKLKEKPFLQGINSRLKPFDR
jgi:NAD+ kinase